MMFPSSGRNHDGATLGLGEEWRAESLNARRVSVKAGVGWGGGRAGRFRLARNWWGRHVMESRCEVRFSTCDDRAGRSSWSVVLLCLSAGDEGPLLYGHHLDCLHCLQSRSLSENHSIEQKIQGYQSYRVRHIRGIDQTPASKRRRPEQTNRQEARDQHGHRQQSIIHLTSPVWKPPTKHHPSHITIVGISIQTSRRHRRVFPLEPHPLNLTRIPVPQNQVIPARNLLFQGHLHIGSDLPRTPHLNIIIHHVYHIDADVGPAPRCTFPRDTSRSGPPSRSRAPRSGTCGSRGGACHRT